MEDNINNYKYDDSVEDLKLKAFVEQAIPQKKWIQTRLSKRHS